MKIAPYICWQLDSTLRPTMKRGFDIIRAQPELISETIAILAGVVNFLPHPNPPRCLGEGVRNSQMI
jgi:hypothetical protein